MIQYEKRFAGWNLVLRLYGAPWPRAFIMALPSTVLCVMLAQFASQGWKDEIFAKTEGFSSFSGLVIFFMTFRTGLSNGRYMECVTNIKNMTTKLSDCATQVVATTEQHEIERLKKGKDASNEFLLLRTKILHSLSLMHALALMRFRGDKDLTNLKGSGFLEEEPEPAVDAAKNKYWMTKRNSASLFFLARNKRHFEDYFNANPLTVLGGVSTAERNLLHQSEDKIYIVNSWMVRLMGEFIESEFKDGKPPLLMARCFAAVSDGVAAYENALKLVTTPFAFPFAQSAAILIHILALLTPLVAMKAGPVWLCGVANFLFIFALYLVNDVSQEIEEPFKYDPNDLPLQHYQWSLNQHLITAYVKGMIPEKSDIFEQLGSSDTMLHSIEQHKPNATVEAAGPKKRKNSMKKKPKVQAAQPVDLLPLVRDFDDDAP